MKSMYGLKRSSMPAFVIADHSVSPTLPQAYTRFMYMIQRLVYYDRYKDGSQFELSPGGLVKAVDQVSKNKLSSKHSENIVERAARVSLSIFLVPYSI